MRVSVSLYVVDDDNAERASLQALLSTRFACVVRGFRSGRAFLEEAAELTPGVLLLDVNTPGAGGLDVLRAVGSCEGRFVPLVLTGSRSVETAVAAMKANAADYLQKPCDARTLIAAVEAAMTRLGHARAARQRRGTAKGNIAKLSLRETEVLKGLIEGRPNKQIAHELSLSPRTVEIYRAKLMDKLDVRSLSEALRVAFTAGLIPEL